MDLELFKELISTVCVATVFDIWLAYCMASGANNRLTPPNTVDWRERWLWGLGGFHVTTLTAVVITRGRPYVQAVIFCLLAVLCFSSEYINEWAAHNYHLFAGEQYFDSSGFFIFTVFAAPIIINCLVIVFLWMCEAWRAMGDLGQAKVRHQLRRKRDSSNKKNK